MSKPCSNSKGRINHERRDPPDVLLRSGDIAGVKDHSGLCLPHKCFGVPFIRGQGWTQSSTPAAPPGGAAHPVVPALSTVATCAASFTACTCAGYLGQLIRTLLGTFPPFPHCCATPARIHDAPGYCSTSCPTAPPGCSSGAANAVRCNMECSTTRATGVRMVPRKLRRKCALFHRTSHNATLCATFGWMVLDRCTASRVIRWLPDCQNLSRSYFQCCSGSFGLAIGRCL